MVMEMEGQATAGGLLQRQGCSRGLDWGEQEGDNSFLQLAYLFVKDLLSEYSIYEEKSHFVKIIIPYS